MALDNKKTGFGFDLEESFDKTRKSAGGHTDTDAAADAHTDTDAHTHAYADVVVQPEETKTKRLYLLAKPSVHRKIDQYAKAHNDSFNNLVHTLMEEFIEKNGL